MQKNKKKRWQLVLFFALVIIGFCAMMLSIFWLYPHVENWAQAHQITFFTDFKDAIIIVSFIISAIFCLLLSGVFGEYFEDWTPPEGYSDTFSDYCRCNKAKTGVAVAFGMLFLAVFWLGGGIFLIALPNISDIEGNTAGICQMIGMIILALPFTALFFGKRK